jgi:hypothetical protein
MSSWNELIESLELKSDDPNGLLMRGWTARGVAADMINAALVALQDGGQGGLTRGKVAQHMHCDPAQVNELASRNDSDLIASAIALTSPRHRHEYLVSTSVRGRTGRDMRGKGLEKGPVGVDRRPGIPPHESLAGWALVTGQQVVIETLEPALKGTVDDPQVAEGLGPDSAGDHYAPDHGLPIEFDDLMLGQLGRIEVAEDAARSLAEETMAAREGDAEDAREWAELHAAQPLLVRATPFGTVKERTRSGVHYRPRDRWRPGLDVAFLAGIDRTGPWAAFALRLDAGGSGDRPGMLGPDALRDAEELIAGGFDGQPVSTSREGGESQFLRVRGHRVPDSRFDLILQIGEAAGTAWTIDGRCTDEDAEVLAGCLQNHLGSKRLRLTDNVVGGFAQGYGLLKIQAPNYEVRSFLRSLALGARAKAELTC